MFINRIREQIDTSGTQASGVPDASAATQPQILPLITIQSIYQAAAERALRDYELDRLFNAEYYGDHGSGI